MRPPPPPLNSLVVLVTAAIAESCAGAFSFWCNSAWTTGSSTLSVELILQVILGVWAGWTHVSVLHSGEHCAAQAGILWLCCQRRFGPYNSSTSWVTSKFLCHPEFTVSCGLLNSLPAYIPHLAPIFSLWVAGNVVFTTITGCTKMVVAGNLCSLQNSKMAQGLCPLVSRPYKH